jgi:hypothetical protein
VLVVWLVQEGTNLTQDEVTTLKEIDFVLNCKQFECPLHNLFGDENFIHLHQPLDVGSWSKPCNNENIQHHGTFKLLKENQNR